MVQVTQYTKKKYSDSLDVTYNIAVTYGLEETDRYTIPVLTAVNETSRTNTNTEGCGGRSYMKIYLISIRETIL